jgi:hypothetical protein
MRADTASRLWFTSDLRRCFLIPARTVVRPGREPIYDLEGNESLVHLAALAPFACSPEQARAHLETAWQDALAAARRAWLDLARFAELTGRELDLGELQQQLQEGLGLAGPQAQEAFAAGQHVVESVLAAATGDSSLTESEQHEVFTRVFSQLPHLVEQFSPASLQRAADDPDAWARSLHEQVYGEVERRHREERRQALAEEIRASIAARLREAGVTPAADLDQEERP